MVSVAVFDRETISPQMMFMWWTPPRTADEAATAVTARES